MFEHESDNLQETVIDIRSGLPETVIKIEEAKCFLCHDEVESKIKFYDIINYKIIEKTKYMCQNCKEHNIMKCVYCDKDYLSNGILYAYSDALLTNTVEICRQCFVYEGCDSCGYLAGASPCRYCRGM